MSQGGANNRGGGGGEGIETLTGNSGGAVGPDGTFNVNIIGNDTTTVIGNPGSSTLTIIPTEGGYPITPYVVGPIGEAGYQTIQSALDAANAAGGGMVWVMPGTYTEDLTFYNGIQISSPSEQSVTIIGTHTPPSSGTLNIDRLTFQSATDIFSSVVAGTTTIIMEDCSVKVTNGYTFNLPNFTSNASVSCFNIGNFGTNDGFFNNTGGCQFFVFASGFGNGTTNTCIVSGIFLISQATQVECPVNFINEANGLIVDSQFTKTITALGNSTGNLQYVVISSGASIAFTHNAETLWTMINCVIDSTHSPAITGDVVATLDLLNCSFINNANISSNLNLVTGKIRGNNLVTRFVVGNSVDTPYTSIQAALDDANAEGGGIVWVKAGSYVVNLTLYDNIILTGDSFRETFIFGTHTLPNSGFLTISNLTLQATNSIFDSPAAATTTIFCNNVNSIITTGFVFDIENWLGNIVVNNFKTAGTNDGFINNIGGATVFAIASQLGMGTSRVMITSGNASFYGCTINCPVTLSGSGTFQIENTSIDGRVTFQGNSTGVMKNGSITPSSGSAITMNSDQPITLSNMILDSSTNPCIAGTGAGILSIATVTYLNNDEVSASLTLSHASLIEGGKFFGEEIALGDRTPSLALDVSVQKTLAGTLGVRVQNDSNDAAAGCQQILVGQIGGGDLWTTYQVSIGGVFSQGIDNSDSDSFKMTNNTTVSIADTILKMTSDGEQTLPLQPSFLASHTVAQNNVTGNGTLATCNYTTEIIDQGGDYDGTNTFTAPVAGNYQFSGSIYMTELDANVILSYMTMVTSNRDYRFSYMNGGPVIGPGNDLLLFGAQQRADMDAADTCIIRGAAVGIGADTADFAAEATLVNYFSGGLIA